MFKIDQKHHRRWDVTLGREQPITLRPINRGSLAGKNIFTMGSCFALEIKHQLIKLGHAVDPRYFDIDFDWNTSSVGKLPERDNINHYNIASILQEFQNIVAPEPLYHPDYYYDLSKKNQINRTIKRIVRAAFGSKNMRFDANWQDPFRKQVYAVTKETLQKNTEAIAEKIRIGAQRADLFIFTMGMTEVWIEKKSGLVVCSGYGGDVDEHLNSFEDLSYEKVRRMLVELITLVRKLRPNADIVFSVSPVPLSKTMKDESLVVANGVSKMKQRLALDEVLPQFENVYYFPSYELALAQGKDFYEDNGMLVKATTVSYILDHFMRWYQGEEAAAATNNGTVPTVAQK